MGRVAERCMCGATDCPVCGPLQGYSLRRFTPDQEAEIDQRADELVIERLYDDPEWFAELMSGTGSCTIEPDLQRAIKNLDAAINGDEIARTAVFTALSNVQKALKADASRQWRDDLRAEAEAALL